MRRTSAGSAGDGELTTMPRRAGSITWSTTRSSGGIFDCAWLRSMKPTSELVTVLASARAWAGVVALAAMSIIGIGVEEYWLSVTTLATTAPRSSLASRPWMRLVFASCE